MTPLGIMLWLAAMVAAIHFAIWPTVEARWDNRARGAGRPKDDGHRKD